MLKFRRKITETLLKWKKEDSHDCAILIDGARRVGKSFVAEEFARKEFPAYLLINFKYASSDVKETFNEYLDRPDVFFQRLFLLTHTKPLPRGSLIIFDEVQEFPRAREAIKPLVADGRYCYIETGSLVSIEENTDGILIPSEERHIKMQPMDFEEFLWADGQDGLMPMIREAFETRTSLKNLHRLAMDEFKAYLLVGGMPQSVKKYVVTHDFNAVDRAKRDILDLYRADIVKHAGAQASKVLAFWDAIPAQLSNHEKTYKISDLSPKARVRDYADPIFWLKDSRTCNFCYNATEPNLGLALSADHTTFKCYMADTGLLVSHAFDENELAAAEIHERIMSDDLSVNKGMLMENVVAQMLVSSGRKLYFYARSDANNRENRLEINFVIAKSRLAKKKNVTPIEIKSGKRTRYASLRKFIGKFSDYLDEPLLFHMKDIKVDEGVAHLPIYMASCI